MRFALTETEAMLQAMSRKLIERQAPLTAVRASFEHGNGYLPAVWRSFGEQQLAGVLTSEAYGGVGAGITEVTAVAEEVGYGLCPVPYTASAVAAALLLRDSLLAAAWLPRLAAGAAVVTPALLEADGLLAPAALACRAEAADSGWRLSGEKWYVPYGHVADAFIVLTVDLGLFLVHAQAPGVARERMATLGLPPVARLVLQETPAEVLAAPGTGWSALQDVLPAVWTAQAAEMTGGLQRVLEHTTQYTNDREQFGRPISGFQAVSHRLADMALELANARLLYQRAAWVIAEGGPGAGRAEAGAAKGYAGEAYRRATQQAHQLLAGHGFILENDLHLFYRHAACVELGYGTAAESWAALGEALGFGAGRPA